MHESFLSLIVTSMFDSLPLPYQFITFAVNSGQFTQGGSVSNLQAGSFPIGAYNKFTQLVANNTGLRESYVPPNPKRDYVMQWNLSVQRELIPDLAATVSYVGSRGIHQPFRADDMNTTLPTLTPAGY